MSELWFMNEEMFKSELKKASEALKISEEGLMNEIIKMNEEYGGILSGEALLYMICKMKGVDIEIDYTTKKMSFNDLDEDMELNYKFEGVYLATSSRENVKIIYFYNSEYNELIPVHDYENESGFLNYKHIYKVEGHTKFYKGYKYLVYYDIEPLNRKYEDKVNIGDYELVEGTVVSIGEGNKAYFISIERLDEVREFVFMKNKFMDINKLDIGDAIAILSKKGNKFPLGWSLIM